MSLSMTVADHIACLTINRPERLNALDFATNQALAEAWVEVRDNPAIWCALVTGAGERSFTVGADLKEAARTQDGGLWRFWQTQADRTPNRGLEIWKPIIAAVNGYCLGAGMLLLFATDIRLAAPHATFALSEVKLGFAPGAGASQRVLRQLPYPIALEFALLGEQMPAARALRYGLINRVTAAETLQAEALAVARRITANGPLAVRAIKELAARSPYLHPSDGLRLEATIARLVETSDDAAEALRAVSERRRPVFRSR